MYVWLYKRLRKTRLSGVHPVYSGVYIMKLSKYICWCAVRVQSFPCIYLSSLSRYGAYIWLSGRGHPAPPAAQYNATRMA